MRVSTTLEQFTNNERFEVRHAKDDEEHTVITINVPDVINPDIQVSAKKFLYVLLHYILGSREVTNFQRKITN